MTKFGWVTRPAQFRGEFLSGSTVYRDAQSPENRTCTKSRGHHGRQPLGSSQTEMTKARQIAGPSCFRSDEAGYSVPPPAAASFLACFSRASLIRALRERRT